MSPPKLDIEIDKTHFKPGETVQGHFAWEVEKPEKHVDLRLFWFTQGKGTEDVDVVDSVRVEAPSLTDRRDFSFRLPAGPYSFSGKLVSLIWALELVTQHHGAQRVEITLSPSGEEIDLR